MTVVYDVVPHVGVGPVRLGMSRAESRAAMEPEEPKPYKKAGEVPVDAYHASSFQVFFDAEQMVEFIELSQFMDGKEVEPRYDGVAVLSLPAAEAIAYVTAKAPFNAEDPELGSSYQFPSLGLALWRPTDDEDDEEAKTFATVAIARPGYFA